MSTINRLLSNYSRQVCLPWSANVSGKHRIWFAVYPPAEERRVRARLPQFEALTLEANHGWSTVDLTRLLPEYLAAHKGLDEPQGVLYVPEFDKIFVANAGSGKVNVYDGKTLRSSQEYLVGRGIRYRQPSV
jgi:hypothetical protein